MKKVAVKAIAASALVALCAAPAARAAEATVGADLASAYVFRGTTFNDGLVAQPYLEVAGLPIDLGVWANFDIDDYDGALEGGQFSEVDFYASYSLPIEAVDVSVGYTEYMYPGAGGAELVIGEDGTPSAESTQGESDREISLSLGLDLPLAPALGVYYGIDGGIEESLYADFGVGHDIELTEDVTLSLGALVGYLDPDDGTSGFSHYEVSASVAYDFVSLGVKYIDTIKDEVLGDGYDVEVVGTLGVSYGF